MITNPYYQVKTQSYLSKRAELIKHTALVNRLDFEPNLSPSFVRPYLSAFSILSKLQRAKNFVLGTREHYSFMICDISYASADDFSTETGTCTIALIFNIAKGGIPDFYTKNRTDLFDFITEYDFELMPKSTDRPFNIFGKNEQLINSFFTPEITQLISNNPYTIECKRRVMLIHNEWSDIYEGEAFENLLSFVDQLGIEAVKKRLEEKENMKEKSRI